MVWAAGAGREASPRACEHVEWTVSTGGGGGMVFTWETAGDVAVLMPPTMLPMTPAMRPLLDPERRRVEVTTMGGR